MTDEQINREIAIVCGWAHIIEKTGYPKGGAWPKEIPSYTTDLKAIHSMEETLTQEQREMYYCFLMMELLPCDENHGPAGDGMADVMTPSMFTLIHAEPKPRAIAFLQTKGIIEHPSANQKP